MVPSVGGSSLSSPLPPLPCANGLPTMRIPVALNEADGGNRSALALCYRFFRIAALTFASRALSPHCRKEAMASVMWLLIAMSGRP